MKLRIKKKRKEKYLNLNNDFENSKKKDCLIYENNNFKNTDKKIKKTQRK